MEIVPFKASHLRAMSLQSSQAYFGNEIAKPGYGEMLEASGEAFSGIHNGMVVGCAGVVTIWENRAYIWALLSPESGRHFVQIHKAVRDKLATLPHHRIEAAVDTNFAAGIRWIEMLGFEREGMMRKYTPNGMDSYLYARVKP